MEKQPTCSQCPKRAHWRKSFATGGGNFAIERRCDDHAKGSGWQRAYPPPPHSKKHTRSIR